MAYGLKRILFYSYTLVANTTVLSRDSILQIKMTWMEASSKIVS
jgi:hypothetical protein